MTIPPIQGGAVPGGSPLRIPIVTAPIMTGIPPLLGDELLGLPLGAPPAKPGASPLRDDAPISLGGRLDQGDALPDTTQLAMALEGATRALQNGRPDAVLRTLDTVWSDQLASDSPWYLRTGALHLLGRMDDAEQVLRDSIAKLPRSAAMLYLLSVHTAVRGNADAARIANDHALSLHPTEPLLWVQRAALAQRAGTPGVAVTILDQLRSTNPAFPAAEWFTMLARLGARSTRSATPADLPVTREADAARSAPPAGGRMPAAPADDGTRSAAGAAPPATWLPGRKTPLVSPALPWPAEHERAPGPRASAPHDRASLSASDPHDDVGSTTPSDTASDDATALRLRARDVDDSPRSATVAGRLTPAGRSRQLTPVSPDAFHERAEHESHPLSTAALESAVRYGLTLLESPTRSARTAKQSAAGSTTGDAATGAYAAALASAAATARAPRTALPSWEAMVLITGAIVIAFVPSLRVPALLACGATIGVLIARRNGA